MAWGIAGMYLLLAVELTSLAQPRVPRRLWRRVHYAGFGVYLMTTVHGLTAGTDGRAPAFLVANAVVASLVAGLAASRVTAGGATGHTRAARGSARQPALRGQDHLGCRGAAHLEPLGDLVRSHPLGAPDPGQVLLGPRPGGPPRLRRLPGGGSPPDGPGPRLSGRPSVTDEDLRWSWNRPAARSSIVRSFTTRYWSAALFTATAAIVSGRAFCSRHSRLVQ